MNPNLRKIIDILLCYKFLAIKLGWKIERGKYDLFLNAKLEPSIILQSEIVWGLVMDTLKVKTPSCEYRWLWKDIIWFEAAYILWIWKQVLYFVDEDSSLWKSENIWSRFIDASEHTNFICSVRSFILFGWLRIITGKAKDVVLAELTMSFEILSIINIINYCKNKDWPNGLAHIVVTNFKNEYMNLMT